MSIESLFSFCNIDFLQLVGLRLLAVVMGCVGLGFLIGFHEFGHFIFCKIFGVSTPTFSIGFGPRIIERKLGDTVFTLSAIPLGGFVEIAGHEEVGQGDQAEAHRVDEHSFTVKPYWQKMAIMGGGILCNVLFAYATLVVLAYIGLPASPLLYPGNARPVVEQVVTDSPADKAGLQLHDHVISIGWSATEQITGTVADLLSHIQQHPDQDGVIVIDRAGERHEVSVRLGERIHCGKREGVLGVLFEKQAAAPMPSVARALARAHEIIGEWTTRTVNAFRSMWERKSLDSIGGPLAVISQTIKGAQGGLALYFLLLAYISLSLALMNLIPVPVFDGGQALLVTIEAILRRKLPESVRIGVHYATWVLLLVTMVYLTYCDLHALRALWLFALIPVGGLVYWAQNR